MSTEQQKQNRRKRDVIVVGGGISGLSAAKELRAHGLDVLVLEARDRVGGRTHTKVDGKLWIDLGGSYVGPTQDSLLNLIEELKLETYLVDDVQDIVYMRGETKVDPKTGGLREHIKRKGTFSPDKDPPFGNIFHWLDYVYMIKLIDSIGAQIPSEAPWSAPKAKEWDSKTFKQFVDENTWTKTVRDYFNNMFVCIDICCEANEVSMLWFLWYVKQCGGYGRTIATTNGGQERKIKNGTQQLSEGIWNIVGKDRVLLNKPVCRIDQSSGPFVKVSTLDGDNYEAKHLICAMPPHLLLKIHHEPALPSEKNLLAQRSPMGQMSKVILYYDKAFWKDHGISGCFLIDSGDRILQPVILSLDETKPDGSHPAIIGFVGARGWFENHNKSDHEMAQVVARCYAKATGLDGFLNFKRVERFDWTQEQYSGGCYTSTHTINTLTKYGSHLREPFGRIYYAGTETAIQWSGYMEGAVSAGKRAAREILHSRGALAESDIWTIEPESKIVPPKPFEYPTSHKYAPSIGFLVKLSQLVLVSGLVGVAVLRRFSFK